jgi:hypothetical protein
VQRYDDSATTANISAIHRRAVGEWGAESERVQCTRRSEGARRERRAFISSKVEANEKKKAGI